MKDFLKNILRRMLAIGVSTSEEDCGGMRFRNAEPTAEAPESKPTSVAAAQSARKQEVRRDRHHDQKPGQRPPEAGL